MQDAEVTRVLVAECFLGEAGEHLVRGKTAGALDQRVGNPGAAVGEALEWVLGRELDHLVLRDREDLGLSGGGHHRGGREEGKAEDRGRLHRRFLSYGRPESEALIFVPERKRVTPDTKEIARRLSDSTPRTGWGPRCRCRGTPSR